ncbi:WxcM-like domain-containing protein [bacterium]|nr:WxcM-like domain-containing protein [bacterium]
MIHPLADVQSRNVGEKTRIWQSVVVLPNARIGNECNICSHCFIENDVSIGNRVTIKSGVQLWDGITIEDDVFIGPNATFTNDRFPRSQNQPESFIQTIVKKGASIGANATILPGITIGEGAMIGAGSVVTKNVPAGAVARGNPAAIHRFIESQPPLPKNKPTVELTDSNFAIEGVRWIQLTGVSDTRGELTVAQWNEHVPFPPQRIFFVHRVPTDKIRGGHAHRQCDQLLVAINGKLKVVVDDGTSRQEISLDNNINALLIPAGVWATQHGYSADCVLAVFASHDYDEADYIRDYETFLSYCQK